jgi:hypothetical protein
MMQPTTLGPVMLDMGRPGADDGGGLRFSGG